MNLYHHYPGDEEPERRHANDECFAKDALGGVQIRSGNHGKPGEHPVSLDALS